MSGKIDTEATFEAPIYDNFQVLIPKEIRENKKLSEGDIIRVTILGKVKVNKQVIPLPTNKKQSSTEE